MLSKGDLNKILGKVSPYYKNASQRSYGHCNRKNECEEVAVGKAGTEFIH